jgi:superfamily II DNA or RNA helicase
MLTMLTQFGYRNIIIADKIKNDWYAGHSILALSGRVDHCYEIQRLLKERYGLYAEVVEKDTKMKDRKRIFKAMCDGTCRIMIATSIAKKGLNIPALSSVHLIFPTAVEEFINQGIGRALRAVNDKIAPVVRDYVDIAYEKARRYFVERFPLYVTHKWEMPNLEATQALIRAQVEKEKKEAEARAEAAKRQRSLLP